MNVNTAQGKELLLIALREVVPIVRSAKDLQLETKIGKEKLQDASACVSDYLESGVSSTLSRNEQLALTVQILKFLARHLQVMSVPITVTNLINNIGLIPEAVENNFPFYRESRLLGYVISKR